MFLVNERLKKRLRGWVFLLPAMLALGAGICAARELSAATIVAKREELAAFPSGRALPILRMGHPSLMADLAWLRAIQYYGEHRIHDRDYPYAEHLFNIITGLDPTFEQAYAFGALILAEDAGSPQKAEALLTRGIASMPDSWWIRFERGFLRMIHLKNLEAATNDFYKASLCPDSPEWVTRFAAWNYEKLGETETARKLWERVGLETENKMVLEIAERALNRLDEAEIGSGDNERN
ncbi:MAG: hypothetical protein KJ970_11005 [Candidatus Eisenbacteria bacterium]|uniref:Tetratricopeptide repeat protein n=1 Tax=Eiseniibacteriota bacterium TaxID=2212470 RepID=A0A948S089_UNCEI|nr:hypothetical protein [Candidatus Eisenbacteria bacterium]MBU1948013.1 hypothetical protein [Candidatus Eisenbacteria bacterium]MBU2691444.1 hypothetical protein [Candidatus Eisenbacteria bacterium]